MTRLLSIFLIAISFSAPAMAQSMLRVKLAGGTPINISVDGRYFDRRGTSITVGDLPPGTHLVRIYAETDYRWGRRYTEVIYKGRVRTDAGMITQLTYDHYNRSQNIQQFDINKDTYSYSNRNNNNSSDAYQPNNNYRDNNVSEPDNRSQQNYTPQQDQDAPAAKDNNRPAASPVVVDEGSMTDTKMSKLRSKVNGKNTDTEKLKVMKDGLQNEKLTTYRVSELMDWFSFESSKLDFAKWAYDYTTDKENFSSLGSKFSYKDSEDDLRKFLQTK